MNSINFKWENKLQFISTLNNKDQIKLALFCISRIKHHITSKAFLDLYDLLVKYVDNNSTFIDVRNQYLNCNNNGILIYCFTQSVYDCLVISAAKALIYSWEDTKHVIEICEISALSLGLDKEIEKKEQMKFIKELLRGYRGCGYYKEGDEDCFLLEKL